MNKKETLHKIINGNLSSEEEKTLLSTPAVTNRMRAQWENAIDMSYAYSVDGAKNLDKITKALGLRNLVRTLQYYKVYSMVASILLVLGCGVWLYQQVTQQPDETYVLVCGRQTVDSITLPDGTHVLISSGSRLTYPKEFKGDCRRVQLSGQAFFEVTENKEKPFIVKTDQMEITALGTAFEVFSFDKEAEGETVLLNGKVKVIMAEPFGEKSSEYILHPNQKLSIVPGGGVKVEAVDANKYSAWRSKGCLSFENEKLSMIVPRLERWYKTKIVCDKRIADTYRFSFTIDNESCSDVLRMLSKTSPLVYHVKEGVYTITRKPI